MLVAAAGSVAAQSVVITPSSPPVVFRGGTYKFTADRPVRWSLAPGSQGTIDADGTYHASTQVRAKQQAGGCQVLPNDHVFNTKIDTLPVHPSSAAWIAAVGAAAPSYGPAFPLNILDSTAATQNMVFAYTSAHNGPFRLPQYPNAKIEGGWFSPPFAGIDRHLIAIDPAACVAEELYNLYPAGTNTYNNCPLCTSQSGVKYSLMTYDLAATGATDAAGMYLEPLTLRVDEIKRRWPRGGAINHALRFSMSNAVLAKTNVWPAMTYAAVTGQMPYGARFRLRPGFSATSINPVTQLLLKQLREYGMFAADGGSTWEITVDDTVLIPNTIRNAFVEVHTLVKSSDLEAVDESSLMISPFSGRVNPNNGYVPLDTVATVIATDNANAANIATMAVALQAVTVGVPRTREFIQAGAGAVQLAAWVNGAAILPLPGQCRRRWAP